jgi:cell division protein FtsZ
MNANPLESPAPRTANTTPITTTLRVIGVGNAGVNILETLQLDAPEDISFVAVNADGAALAASTAPTKLQLESKLLRGLGTGGDPERGQAAAEENFARLGDACRGAEVVLIVAGLGGGAGTGISPVLARAAKEAGAMVLACAVTPFACEGRRRQRQAQFGLEQLRAVADGLICLPNQKVFKLIDEHTSLVDTFKAANELLADGLRGVLRLLGRQGVMPIHLNELCALLRGRHAESALATVEAHGPTRARDAVEKLLAHPLLDGGQALATAGAVVVSIHGGADLSMADINRVMEQVNRQCENAQVLMGATVDEAFRDRLNITLIVTRREERDAKPTEGDANEPAPRARTASPTGDDTEFLQITAPTRSRTRLVPPAPALPPEQLEQALARQNGAGGRPRKVNSRLRQGTLPLDVVSRGRFDKTEPNIHRGEDLDTPTYLRRGLVLN